MSVRPFPFALANQLLVLFLVCLALYVFSLSDNLSAAHDSIQYINDIDAGQQFHPHHLLYNSLAIAWVSTWRALGDTSDSVRLVALLNSVFGSLTLCAFYAIVRRRLRLDRLSALFGTALPAFSFGIWFYSVCIEVYMVPLFLLTWCFYELTSDPLDRPHLVLVGFIQGLAVLFHETHLLFTPAVLLAIYWLHRQSRYKWAAMSRSLVAYGSSFLPTVLLPYALVGFGLFSMRSAQQFWYWVTAYLQIPDFGYWQPLGLTSILKAGLGFIHSLIGLHFVLAFPPARTWINHSLSGHHLVDEAFLVRNLEPGVAIFLLVLLLVLLVVFLGLAVFSLRSWRLVWVRHSTVVLLTLGWLIPYIGFFVFWDPENVEFWLPQSICWWCLFLAGWSAWKDEPTRRFGRPWLELAFVAGLLLVLNFAGSIRFLQQRQNDYYYQSVAPLTELAQRQDLVVTGPSPVLNHWILDGYIQRFTPARSLDLALAGEMAGQARNLVGATLAEGHRVFVLGDTDTSGGSIVLPVNTDTTARDGWWAEYQATWRKLDFGVSTLYILARQGQ